MSSFSLLGVCLFLVSGFTLTKGCEDGWTWWDNKCYFFSINFLVWEDARMYCKNNGAHLLIVDTKEEHDFIRRRISDMHLHYVWIGAKYSTKYKKHLWIDGSEMTLNGWAPGEPDGRRGCVDYLQRYNYEWNSHCDCIHTRGRFICEKGCDEGWTIQDQKCVLIPEPSSSLIEVKTYCEEHGAILTNAGNGKDGGTFVCEKECEIGWEKFGNKCYRFSDQSRSWESAQSYCQDAQGSLVKVENQQEHEYIQQKISDANHVFVWIGARYNPDYGKHQWVDGSPLNFTMWAPGLPGNSQGCVDYLHKYSYMWNSHNDCKNTKGPFICQKVRKSYETVSEETIKDTDFENSLMEGGMIPKITTTPEPEKFAVNLDEVFKGSYFCDEETTTTTDSYISEMRTPYPKIKGVEMPLEGRDSFPSIGGGSFPSINGESVPSIGRALGLPSGELTPPISGDLLPSITGKLVPSLGEDNGSSPTESDPEDRKISAVVESPSGAEASLSFACFPNNTVEVYELPQNSYYLAIQNTTSGTITKCTVSSLDSTSVKITGCIKDDPIIFSYGTYLGIESHEIHFGVSVKITCVEIPVAGVSHSINGSYSATLQLDEDTAITSSYTVTSSLNATDAQVGDPVALTILFPVEYTLKVTSCTGKPDTSDIGAKSVQLISNEGCTVNTELISNFESSPGSAFAVLRAFKFYGYDSIILRCDVRVCPSSGTAACITTCTKRKRDILRRPRRLANDSFPAYIENRLAVSGQTISKGSNIGPPATMLLLNFVFSLYLMQ